MTPLRMKKFWILQAVLACMLCTSLRGYALPATSTTAPDKIVTSTVGQVVWNAQQTDLDEFSGRWLRARLRLGAEVASTDGSSVKVGEFQELKRLRPQGQTSRAHSSEER